MTWKRKPKRWIERIPIVVKDAEYWEEERRIAEVGFKQWFSEKIEAEVRREYLEELDWSFAHMIDGRYS